VRGELLRTEPMLAVPGEDRFERSVLINPVDENDSNPLQFRLAQRIHRSVQILTRRHSRNFSAANLSGPRGRGASLRLIALRCLRRRKCVADVMLATPKTLPSQATVAQVRDALDNPHTEMVLLVDDRAFRGAVVAIPDEADPGASALDYAEQSPEMIAPTEPASSAFSRTRANLHRRAVVLDVGET
jgi:hypothetical protein